MEQLLDYNSCITFVPLIAIGKALRHIPHRDILHCNVCVVSVLIGGVEFDKPFVLFRCQTIVEINWTRPMPVIKRCRSGQNLLLIMPVDFESQPDAG